MKNKVQNYLINLLTNIEPYYLSDSETKTVQRDRVEYMVGKLTRKKFRRRKLSRQTRDTIKQKIKMSVDQDRPIHLTIPFGGYKHFWNTSYPEPDWAELFNFRYLTDLVLPILTVHSPGVIIEYISEDMILNRMNNYPLGALDSYSEIFGMLIEWFNKQVPDNLEFKFFRVGDRVDKEKLIFEVEKILPERLILFEKLSDSEKEEEIHRSMRSIFWDGDIDLTSLSPEEKKRKVIESRLIELAYYDVEAQEQFLGNYICEDNHIGIMFSFGTTRDNDEIQDLTIGTTYGSIVDHWIGRGILMNTSKGLRPSIVSQNQFQQLAVSLEVFESNLLLIKNFNQIEVAR